MLQGTWLQILWLMFHFFFCIYTTTTTNEPRTYSLTSIPLMSRRAYKRQKEDYPSHNPFLPWWLRAGIMPGTSYRLQFQFMVNT
jgi:hypothetical protein